MIVPDWVDEKQAERYKKAVEKLEKKEFVDKIPVFIPEKDTNMFEAFEAMHKQDGTSNGKPKCDTYL